MLKLDNKEHAERIYGRLQESAHISGHTFEHMCKELETLIDNEQWQTIGSGYTDFSQFIRTIDLSKFNFGRPKRKRLAEKMKKAGASNVAIADAIGVDEKTVRNITSEKSEQQHKDTEATSDFSSEKSETDTPSVHYSSETDEWATPQPLFDVLNAEFNFTLDVCATADNAKCRRFYSRAEDGLSQQWPGSCWMNPPYGDEIGKWVAKACEAAKEGATVVCLLPARVDTAWWWDYCRFTEIRFLRGRLKFGNGENSAPFPSAAVVFPHEPRVVWWEGWNAK